jgi:outer membrane murein-binding lipoprotein Lpp
MKKTLMAAILSITVLTGCSAVNDVTNGLNYIPAATDYINEVQQFSKDIPALAETAITDQNARVKLEEALKEMKAEINEFGELTPPSVFEDVHNQVIEHNSTFQEGIDNYLTAVKNGELNHELLEQSGLLDDIAVYTDLLSQIKKLGE